MPINDGVIKIVSDLVLYYVTCETSCLRSGSRPFRIQYDLTCSGKLKMPGVVHHQSVNIIVADLHDGVITAEELNQETTGEEVAVNEKKTFSESELKKKGMELQLCLVKKISKWKNKQKSIHSKMQLLKITSWYSWIKNVS